MPDIIHLLPDSVANQIAAGEVVQRPASVVKELLENAIDAGSTIIQLVVKDAGKTLIQVSDNGRGMSETDARMCFERHATSKIRKSEDLFHIVTKGFRGEALASIAAVAQVELRSRQTTSELGTQVIIEGSKVKSQEHVQCPSGTTFSVKNLFFNVPARRYFLKSDPIELRHIIDEFHRVALSHSDIEFQFHHNGAEVFKLPAVPLRQRIVHVFGNKYNEKLVPVEESTDIIGVSGFIGKPDAAKKTRGEQYFFINNRFIRNSYLHHAVISAYQNLLPQGHFPLYLLYFTIDPEQIDINIHPTKTEVKFRDERAVYAIIHAATRRALGKFNISPSLDFDQETAIQISMPRAGQEISQPRIDVNPGFNPFEQKDNGQMRQSTMRGWFDQKEKSASGWQEMLKIATEVDVVEKNIPEMKLTGNEAQLTAEFINTEDLQVIQMMRQYIISVNNGSMMVIDQQRAHQRILFEKYLDQLQRGSGLSQQILFPEEIHLTPADQYIMSEHNLVLQSLGFGLEKISDDLFHITGLPSDLNAGSGKRAIEELIGEWKNETGATGYSQQEKTAWVMAAISAVRYGQMLTVPEMHGLVEQLMKCRMPYSARDNKPILITMNQFQLEQQFR